MIFHLYAILVQVEFANFDDNTETRTISLNRSVWEALGKPTTIEVNDADINLG